MKKFYFVLQFLFLLIAFVILFTGDYIDLSSNACNSVMVTYENGNSEFVNQCKPDTTEHAYTNNYLEIVTDEVVNTTINSSK